MQAPTYVFGSLLLKELKKAIDMKQSSHSTTPTVRLVTFYAVLTFGGLFAGTVTFFWAIFFTICKLINQI